MTTKSFVVLLAGLFLALPLGAGRVAEAQPGPTPLRVCNDPDLAIPDAPLDPNAPHAVASDTISVADGGTLCDLDVYVNVPHTWVGDLDFTLTHTGGAGPVTIIDRPGHPAFAFGCPSDDYDVTVNDEGPDGDIESQCDATPPAINGDRVGGDPAGPVLSAFDGEDFSGDWTLTIRDNSPVDTGTLVEWCLVPTFCQEDLSHFMCYEVRRQPAFPGLTGVTLDDQFGPGMVNVNRRKRLCNPADKFHPDTRTAVDDEEHLVSYEIRQRDPRFVPVEGVRVLNQFGEITVDVRRPERLLVPTAKDQNVMPPPLVDPALDHFKCYRVRGARQRVEGLIVNDQFGQLTVDVKRPYRLCVPADKNGEGINDLASHLMCYRTRTQPRRQLHGVPFFINNQFEETAVVITGPRELCVPSVKIPPEPSCGLVPQRGEPATCGGTCPPEQQCLFDDGDCRCTDESQACAFVPDPNDPRARSVPRGGVDPNDPNQPPPGPGGMCLGLCTDPGDICTPIAGASGQCQCVTPPAPGDCCTDNSGNPTPGCNDPTCEQAICAADPFCCNTNWDLVCANQAAREPTCQQCFQPGDCCTDNTGNPTPGCDDPTCEAAVCAGDQFCCDTVWDSICANEAAGSPIECPQCIPPPPGDCCTDNTGNPTPGCDDPTCEAAVCLADASCCDVSWNDVCAALATTLLADCPQCGS